MDRIEASLETEEMNPEQIEAACGALRSLRIRGDLGKAISSLVLGYAPRDLAQMRANFSGALEAVNPGYRRRLEDAVTGHLHGTYQALRLMHQQGSFDRMEEPVVPASGGYWEMVSTQCRIGEDGQVRLRFLKFLLSGFCMFVQGMPGHPVGMEFPGGDRVQCIDSVYYCPVREKAYDVDAALCPFCPALQTPDVGYLKPPVEGSSHRKQEYIQHVYEHHHFNG